MKKIKRFPAGSSVFMIFLLLCAAVLLWDAGRSSTAAASPVSALQEQEQPRETAEAEGARETAALRMQREQERDAEARRLQELSSDPAISPGVLEGIQLRQQKLALEPGQETEAEALLRAKGYGETLVFLGENGATVLVEQEIDADSAADIAAAVDHISDCGFTNVVIVKREDFCYNKGSSF